MPARAAHVLSSHWNNTIPVNPAQIAREYGALVKALSSQIRDRLGASQEVSGALEISDDGTPTIWFANSEAPVRQRFTVAHELGHP